MLTTELAALLPFIHKKHYVKSAGILPTQNWDNRLRAICLIVPEIAMVFAKNIATSLFTREDMNKIVRPFLEIIKHGTTSLEFYTKILKN